MTKLPTSSRPDLATRLLSAKRKSLKTVESYALRVFEMYAGLVLKPGSIAPESISSWKWLSQEERVLAWIEEHKSSSLSNRKMYLQSAAAVAELAGFKAASRSYLSLAYSYNAQQQEEKLTQTLSDAERVRYETPKVLRSNVAVLGEVLRILGTSQSGLAPGISKDAFKQLWMAYPLMKLLSLDWGAGQERVFRSDVGYTTHLVDRATSNHSPEWLAAENYFEYDSRTTGPVRLQLNHYKTEGKGKGKAKHGPVTIMLGDDGWLKSFYLSIAAYPRSYMISSVRDSSKPLSDGMGSLFIKRWGWVLDDRAQARRPGANEIRSSIATEFYDTHASKLGREEFARRSMSSDNEMQLSYFKIGESGMMKKFREERQAKLKSDGVDIFSGVEQRAESLVLRLMSGSFVVRDDAAGEAVAEDAVSADATAHSNAEVESPLIADKGKKRRGFWSRLF